MAHPFRSRIQTFRQKRTASVRNGYDFKLDNPDIIATLSGAPGPGIGKGASKIAEGPAPRSRDGFWRDIIDNVSGAPGPGIGKGASKATLFSAARCSEFESKMFLFGKVLREKSPGENDVLAPCELVAEMANASVITDIFRLINY